MATIMDPKSGEVLTEIAVGVEPEGVGVSPDSKFTVVTSESTSMAHVIDNEALKLIANVLVDSRPREAKFTPDGKQVWVSSEVGGSVSVIDAATWKLIKKIRFDVPGVRPQLLQPVGMEFTKDGKLMLRAKVGDKELMIDGTYKVDGKNLSATLTFMGKSKTEKATIRKLTDKELVLEDEKGKVEEYKRVK